MSNFALRLLVLLLVAPLAVADKVEAVDAGEIITTSIPDLTTGAATNAGGGPDLAIIFDGHAIGTADPDLEDPLGNLAGTQFPGNQVDSSDDERSRPAGTITFLFDEPIDRVGLDPVDGESGVLENGKLIFHDVDGTVVMHGFDGLGLRDGSIRGGDDSINNVPPGTAAEMGLNRFDRVGIVFGDLGAMEDAYAPAVSCRGVSVSWETMMQRREGPQKRLAPHKKARKKEDLRARLVAHARLSMIDRFVPSAFKIIFGLVLGLPLVLFGYRSQRK